MDKQDKIEEIVKHWLKEMDLDALMQFYIDMKTYELEQWSEADLDCVLGRILERAENEQV
jgi:hypothetical protein